MPLLRWILKDEWTPSAKKVGGIFQTRKEVCTCKFMKTVYGMHVKCKCSVCVCVCVRERKHLWQCCVCEGEGNSGRDVDGQLGKKGHCPLGVLSTPLLHLELTILYCDHRLLPFFPLSTPRGGGECLIRCSIPSA